MRHDGMQLRRPNTCWTTCSAGRKSEMGIGDPKNANTRRARNQNKKTVLLKIKTGGDSDKRHIGAAADGKSTHKNREKAAL